MRKSDALGSPTGREARTTRFADCDMVVSSDFLFSSLRGAKRRSNPVAVIPGRCQRGRAKRGPMTGSASNPESRDSGSGANAPSRNDGVWIASRSLSSGSNARSLPLEEIRSDVGFLPDRVVVAIDAVGDQGVARDDRVLVELDRVQPDHRGPGAAIPFERG